MMPCILPTGMPDKSPTHTHIFCLWWWIQLLHGVVCFCFSHRLVPNTLSYDDAIWFSYWWAKINTTGKDAHQQLRLELLHDPPSADQKLSHPMTKKTARGGRFPTHGALFRSRTLVKFTSLCTLIGNSRSRYKPIPTSTSAALAFSSRFAEDLMTFLQ